MKTVKSNSSNIHGNREREKGLNVYPLVVYVHTNTFTELQKAPTQTLIFIFETIHPLFHSNPAYQIISGILLKINREYRVYVVNAGHVDMPITI